MVIELQVVAIAMSRIYLLNSNLTLQKNSYPQKKGYCNIMFLLPQASVAKPAS